MTIDNELKKIELIYNAIYQECEISLYDTEAYDHNFSRKIVNMSLTLFNYAFKLSRPNMFSDLPNMSVESIKSLLTSIYKIITGIYFYNEKEQKIKELLEDYSLDIKKIFEV